MKQANRHHHLASMVAAGLLGICSMTLQASESAVFTVSATVMDYCTISTTPLDFGNYDPIDVNYYDDLLSSSVLTVQCTVDTAASITLSGGQNYGFGGLPDRYMTSGEPVGGESVGAKDLSTALAYQLYADAGMTQEWGDDPSTSVDHIGTGSAVELTVHGRIPGGQNVPATSYQDTVVATISF